MGAYWTAYLGVYLEVKEGKEKKMHKYYVDDIGNRKNTPFDPLTGERYHEMEEEKEHVLYPSPYEFEREEEFSFFNPEYS